VATAGTGCKELVATNSECPVSGVRTQPVNAVRTGSYLCLWHGTATGQKPTFDNRSRIATIRTVHLDAGCLSTNRDRERAMASVSEPCIAEPSDVHRLVIVEGIIHLFAGPHGAAYTCHSSEVAKPSDS